MLLKFGAPARAGLLHDLDHHYRCGSTDYKNGDSYYAADTRARLVERQEQPAGEARRIDESTDPADTGRMLPRLRPTPARHFTEPIPPASTDADGIDRIYIRCLQSQAAARRRELVRFLLDHDVDAAVGPMLRQRGHECWTAGSAGLARAKDDELTVWAAEHQAVVVSTDGEFSQRRMQNAIGWHIRLRCSDWEAGDVLADHLDEVLILLEARNDLAVRVSKEGLSDSSRWT